LDKRVEVERVAEPVGAQEAERAQGLVVQGVARELVAQGEVQESEARGLEQVELIQAARELASVDPEPALAAREARKRTASAREELAVASMVAGRATPSAAAPPARRERVREPASPLADRPSREVVSLRRALSWAARLRRLKTRGL